MSRRNESLGYALIHEWPWWVSLLLGALCYAFLEWMVPSLIAGKKATDPVVMALGGLHLVSWIPFMVFGPVAVLSLWVRFLNSVAAKRHASAVATEAPPAVPGCVSGRGSCLSELRWDDGATHRSEGSHGRAILLGLRWLSRVPGDEGLRTGGRECRERVARGEMGEGESLFASTGIPLLRIDVSEMAKVASLVQKLSQAWVHRWQALEG